MKMKLAASILGLAIISTGGTTFAGIASDTAIYTITLTAGCTINTTAASTDFGAYPVDNVALTGVNAGSIAVDCTTGTPYMVGMNEGSNWTGTSPAMIETGGATIPYNIIYNGSALGDNGLNSVDSGYVETNSAASISDSGTGVAVNYTLTADIALDPAGLTPGSYADTVLFTVVW
ncbi:MAG: spore coat U domain-containing protein [Desulfobulbaceae bacterium]|nr:spore coat U domain-containing protein [Desulfobulbaceae bacterium]